MINLDRIAGEDGRGVGEKLYNKQLNKFYHKLILSKTDEDVLSQEIKDKPLI